MKKLFLLIIVTMISFSLFAQDHSSSIVFYNVENLFDTVDDPQIKDDDFTPEGKKNWTVERYQKKLNDLAKVISSITPENLPAIVGFAEIENKLVLEDLIKTEYLQPGNYKIVHEESPDIRGIDVGLIYNPDDFSYLSHQKIPIPIESEYKVRDILYVKGILHASDTLHVFVNHWKSRSGGQEATEPQRIQCAKTLRNSVDSVLAVHVNAKILIMGDLNDEPKNKSIYETLQANNSQEKESLYNLMLPLVDQNIGSYSYRGNWNLLDNIIISNNLLSNEEGFAVSSTSGNIFSAEWITFTNKGGQKSPNKTYGGPNYYGGYSDHYPVYIILKK